MVKSKKMILAVVSVCAVLLIGGLAACAPQQGTKASPESSMMPTPDEFGVVTAEGWSQLYPNQYATYLENEANSPDSGKHDYLQMYPALNTMYKGYAFSLDYDEPAAHNYALQSVSETQRTIKKEQLANCITCKTPQFTNQVNTEGDGVYALKFNDMIGTYTEPISCFNCHGNDPTATVQFQNQFYHDSLGNDEDRVAPESASCGQCHNEYYFNPDTKVTTNPYSGLAAMTPQAIIDYYDERGYKDWEHPDTGAAMLKCQHPEFETVYGGNQTHMAKLGYTCADCHMSTEVAEDGTTFTSHNLISPLENETLISTKCISCHDDIKAEVAAWQAKSEEQVIAVSEQLENYINQVKAQKDAGTLTGDRLAQAQKIHREAQFLWDFVMNENSEGAHNPELSEQTLNQAQELINQGMQILNG